MGAEHQPGRDAPGASAPASGPTPGQILNATREQAGIDLNQAARAANLGVSVVTAMESDDYSTLGLPVYARGYYRRYAKVIGCDPEAVLTAYERSTDNPSPVPNISQRPSIPYAGRSGLQKALPLAALLGVAFVVAYLFLRADAPSEPSRASADSSPGSAGANERHLQPSPKPTLAPLPDTRRPVEVDMQEARDQQASAGGTERTLDRRTDSSSGLKLSTGLVPPNRLEIITGPQAAWIEVVDALGERHVYRVVNPGETVVIDGEPPYSVNLGMAHTLRIRYGGKDIDLQAATDSASRARATIAANGEVVPR